MKKIKYDALRMQASFCDGVYSLNISITSGFADFVVTIPLSRPDFEVIEKDIERAAFLQAALHEPFQLRATALDEVELRRYLDVILHGSKLYVEDFLTQKDHDVANGAISNMVRITCGREQSLMRQGKWFSE
ncbi:hypothetical protein ACK39A_13525 [Aeromonas veronii]